MSHAKCQAQSLGSGTSIYGGYVPPAPRSAVRAARHRSRCTAKRRALATFVCVGNANTVAETHVAASALGADQVDTPRRARSRLVFLGINGQPVVQQGLRSVLQHDKRIGTVEMATTGEEGVAKARRAAPHLVLVDPKLPDMLLSDVIRRLRGASPRSKVVVFPTHVTPTLRAEALRLCVDGLLGQDASPAHLVDVVLRVAEGEVITQPVGVEALARLAQKLQCAPLTLREHEIMLCASRGESNAEIAQTTYLAPTTVKSYVHSTLTKLGARNRAEAVFILSDLCVL